MNATFKTTQENANIGENNEYLPSQYPPHNYYTPPQMNPVYGNHFPQFNAPNNYMPYPNADISMLRSDVKLITTFMGNYINNNEKVIMGMDRLLLHMSDIDEKIEKNTKWRNKINSKIDANTKTLNNKINNLEKQIEYISEKKVERKRYKKNNKTQSPVDKMSRTNKRFITRNNKELFEGSEPSISSDDSTDKIGPSNNISDMGMLGSLIEAINNSEHNSEGNNDDEQDKCINSEDEYDYDDGDIFVNENDITIDDEFVKLDANISTIDDIIELGKQFNIPEDEIINKPVKKQKNEHGKRVLINPATGMVFISNLKKNMEGKKEDEDKQSVVQYDKGTALYKYDNKYYSIDPIKLARLVKPLSKLKRMVGLDNIKDSILNFVTHYLQQKTHDKMLHTVIEGPPGVGKTRLGKILAEIYSAMGVIPSSRCKIVTSNDLIGQYQGHTIKKTQKVLDEAEGGVLFIDEAYTLGSTRDDSYSRICLNCINENLDKKRKNLILIFAGYAGALEKLVFSQNEGLRRRFPFKYEMKGYTDEEMKDIFISFIRKKHLKLDSKISENDLTQLFKKEKNNLGNFGGDLENIVNGCQILCDRKRFGDHPQKRNIITLDIINKSMNDHVTRLGSNSIEWNNMYS